LILNTIVIAEIVRGAFIVFLNLLLLCFSITKKQCVEFFIHPQLIFLLIALILRF